jgi:hypothetical protein
LLEHSVFISFEVNDTVAALVPTTTLANGHSTIIITTPALLQRSQEAFLRFAGGYFEKVLPTLNLVPGDTGLYFLTDISY